MSPGAPVTPDRLPLPAVMADPDGNEVTGNRNYAAWSRRLPCVCACGSVSNFPCTCQASGGTAVAS